MREHGEKIFKDWYYDTNTENDTRTIHFTLFKPVNKRWEEIRDSSPKFIELSDMQKKSTYKCFDKLHYIIGNIFHIMDNGGIINNKYLETATSLITSNIIRPSDYGHLLYKPSQTQTTNIRYTKNSRDERKSLIDLDDLNKGKLISGRSVVRSRSADPRGRVEVPLHRPSVRVRSVDAPTYRPPVRREGDTRDGRGHFAEPPRGRTGRDGRHPDLVTGYRRGGMPMKRRNTNWDSNEYNFDTTFDDERTGAPVIVPKYGNVAPQANIITKEEAARARQDANDNLIKVQENYKKERERIATLEREETQRMRKKTKAASSREDIKTE
jgi:hypothetical protein